MWFARARSLGLACLFLLCAQLGIASLINENVKRVIDVTSTMAISRVTITMKNVGDAPVDSFTLALCSGDADNTHDVWACEPSVADLKALPMHAVSDVVGLGSSEKAWRISFSSPLQPDRSTTVDVRMDVWRAITPVPSELRGSDPQYMRFVSNAHFFSPYQTESEETSVILGSSSITSKFGLTKPFTLSGKRLKLGPYSKTPPLSQAEFSVRFLNEHGFLVAQRAVKELRVGHWGSVAVSEEFEVVNAAARHVGEWSRVEYADFYSSPYKTAIGDVWVNLPPDASRVEYRDLIGNITSSRLRKPTSTKRALQITFRYPLMGGWRNHFWYSYDVAHESLVHSDGMSHWVKVPIWPTINADLLCESLELRIILPEWADNIKVDRHPSLTFKQSTALERMSLTMFGRQIVSLKMHMIRSKSKHDGFVVIHYQYNPLLRWVTPSLTVIGILMGFVVSLAFVRSGIDITEKAVQKTKLS